MYYPTWLLSRRRLLIAAVVDSANFLLLNAYAFWRHFGDWSQFSMLLTSLLCVWLIASYVIGRYYDANELKENIVVSQLVRTFICLLLCIVIFLVWMRLAVGYVMAEESRGLILTVMCLFAIFSGVSQQALNLALQRGYASPKLWLVAGSTAFFQQLQDSLSLTRIKANLQHLEHCDFPSQTSLQGVEYGVVVEGFSSLSLENIQVLLRLQAQDIVLVTMMGWSERMLQRFPPRTFLAEELLRGQFATPQAPIYKRLKRAGDLFVSSILLLALFPFLLLLALLIRLEDGGPSFYCQLRSGLGGVPFYVLKFRSMRVDAEVSGPQWSTRGDRRITRIGRLIRVTRIDELPQLWSVITGKMSLIGPRPERPEIEHDLINHIPNYRLRYLMRPGLSGWAQVNYPYGSTVEDSENKLSYDLYYLKCASLSLDLLIFLKTVRLVFNGRGAIR